MLFFFVILVYPNFSEILMEQAVKIIHRKSHGAVLEKQNEKQNQTTLKSTHSYNRK